MSKHRIVAGLSSSIWPLSRADRGREAAVAVGVDQSYEEYCQPSRGNYAGVR